MRLLSAEAGIRLSQMRSGSMSEQDWQKIVRRMSEISDAPLFIDDSPNMTMMEIRAKARRLKQRNDLRLIVVDYLQLMTSGKRVESRQQEVSEFSRQMKLLAKELEVPVIAISQLNRGPEQRTDKRPMLSDLRESGSLEQDADMVVLVHRPDAWEADDPRAGRGRPDHRQAPQRADGHHRGGAPAALLPLRRPRRMTREAARDDGRHGCYQREQLPVTGSPPVGPVVTGTALFEAWQARNTPPVEKVAAGVWSVPVPVFDLPIRYTLCTCCWGQTGRWSSSTPGGTPTRGGRHWWPDCPPPAATSAMSSAWR